MDPQEYINLARVEKDHWYYAGKRELVRRWIGRIRAPGERLRMLDCGAGTGYFALELDREHEVHVLDDHAESLRILGEKFPSERVHSLGPKGLPFEDASFDVVTLMDVLEHIEHDGPALEEIWRVLKPGGHVLVTVPASMKLWSDWDVALHHFRRYDRRGLSLLFAQHGRWDPLYLNYTNFLVFPLVWLVRKYRQLNGRQRGEDYLPPSWINWILRRMFVWQGLLRVPMPWGVSLIMVATRKA